MSQLDDAAAVVTHANNRRRGLAAEYDRCLNNHEVSVQLRLGVKEVLEHCRSSLDYLAHFIADSIGGAGGGNTYFPIAARTAKPADFTSFANKKIAGVRGHPQWLIYLAKAQVFTSEQNVWLCDLADFVNLHKHERLVAQERRKTRELHITSGNTGMVLGEGASVFISDGGGMLIGNLSIGGSQTFGVGAPPRARGPGKVEEVTWVRFLFEGTDVDVLSMLEACCVGCAQLVDDARTIAKHTTAT